jgi:hypothetical protein
MRHNLRMPQQTSPQRWRAPAMLRVKSFIVAAVGALAAVVFFPLWFAVPVTLVLAGWGLGLAVLGASVTLDSGAERLTLRMGLIVRRIGLTDITAVIVDGPKMSLGRASGGEVSLYAWRKGRLDALLGLPAAASDIGHTISQAATEAQASSSAHGLETAPPAGSGRTPARTRSRLATALLGGAGVLAIGGALLVRVHWHSPVLTVLGVVIALALGVSGLLYLLVALWILLTGHAPRTLFSQ